MILVLRNGSLFSSVARSGATCLVIPEHSSFVGLLIVCTEEKDDRTALSPFGGQAQRQLTIVLLILVHKTNQCCRMFQASNQTCGLLVPTCRALEY